MPLEPALLEVEARCAGVCGEPEPQHGGAVLVPGVLRRLENEQDVPGGEPLDVLHLPACEERLELVAQLSDVVSREAHGLGVRLAQASSSLTE